MILLCLLCLALLAPPVLAQVPSPSGLPAGASRVLGIVSDHERGQPLEQATVTLLGPEAVSLTRLTGEDGRFLFEEVSPGTYELSVTALGYTSLVDTLEVEPEADHELSVELSVSPIPLEPLVTVAPRNPRLRGFEERRRTARGTYLDRAEIELRNPHRLSDLVRGVPGASLVRLEDGSYGLRFRGDCVPSVWVDGIKTASDSRLETGLDQILLPDEIAAMEVYRGAAEVPVEFRPERCGALILWTRPASEQGEEGEKKGSFWGRVAVLSAFVLLGVIMSR